MSPHILLMCQVSSKSETVTFFCLLNWYGMDPYVWVRPAHTGPVEGGTAITVMGTDFGGTFVSLQNSNLTLGGVACTPLIIGYIPWQQFVCETTNFVTEGSKEFSLTIDSRVAIVNSGSFTAVDPTVSSVTPTFGPMAGGTAVVVRGTGLDVGNQVDTRVSLEVSGSNYVCNISWVILYNESIVGAYASVEVPKLHNINLLMLYTH